MDIKEKILVALGLDKEPVKMAWQAKTEDGTILTSTADELAAGVDISVLTEDGTTIPLPIGTYKTDTGVSFRVEEEGVVAEVMETETEEEVTPKEEMGEDRGEDDDEVAVDDWEGMEKRIKNLEDAIADIKSRLGESDTEDVEMAEETTDESKEEVAEEVKEEVAKAVSGDTEAIAKVINDNTPDSVTPAVAKEIAEAVVEKVEEKVEEVSLSKLKEENEKLKAELAARPADVALNTNKFSSEKPRISKAAYNKLSKREKILMDINK